MGDQTKPAVLPTQITVEHNAEQIIRLVANENSAHATGLAFLAGGTDLPARVATQSINLLNILCHLEQVRLLANVRGYTDILELLDQKLPYETYR